ncbi:hypothetical protein [Streptomyces sp. NPDC004976]
MTVEHTRALRPVEAGPGVLVHPSADRRLAVEHWLAAAHRRPSQARHEWRTTGMTLLPLGTLFSAVRLPARVVYAVLGRRFPSRDLDVLLDGVFEGGPVICDPAGHRYYALVPARMPVTWHEAADDWREDDVECLGHGAYLGIPAPSRTECIPGMASYWSVPMSSAGQLCAPLNVARLIAAARHVLGAAVDLEA